MRPKKRIVLQTKDTGLVQVVSELHRLKEIAEIELFRDERGLVIYEGIFLSALLKSRPEIFKSKPRWTLAEMIDYATGGRIHFNKTNFISAVLRNNDPQTSTYDPEIDTYIELKSKGTYTRASLLERQTIRDSHQKESVGIDLASLKEDIYLAIEEIARLTDLTIQEVVRYGSYRGMELQGNGLNLKILIPYLNNTGRQKEAQILYKAYLSFRTHPRR